MSKRHLKIFIMTVIVMAFFALIGTTYAYYEVRIIENENSNSLEIESKYLAVVYKDGEDTFSPLTDEYIFPGYTFTKEFKVENTGTDPAQFHIVLRNVQNEFTRVKDWRYELKLIKSNGSEEVLTSGIFPTEEKKVIYREGEVEYQEEKNFKLTISYLETTESQNVDINKNIEATIDIEDASTTLNHAEEGTLLYAINRDNEITDTKTLPGREVSAEDEALLAATLDDYGETYYFRGSVNNNFVDFAGMCWRIVRVQGNGTIKLILQDYDSTCASSDGTWYTPNSTNNRIFYFGYNYGSITNSLGKLYTINYLHSDSELSMANVFKYFQDNKLSSDLDKLVSGKWCYNDNVYAEKEINTKNAQPLNDDEIIEKIENDGTVYYDSYVRLVSSNNKGFYPTLKCQGTLMNSFEDTNNTPMYVATLTADEVVFAGTGFGKTSTSYYLIDDAYTELRTGHFWTLTPSHYSSDNVHEHAFYIHSDGQMSFYYVGDETITGEAVRPSVILKSDVNTTTNEDTKTYGEPGTKTNPYVIK